MGFSPSRPCFGGKALAEDLGQMTINHASETAEIARIRRPQIQPELTMVHWVMHSSSGIVM